MRAYLALSVEPGPGAAARLQDAMAAAGRLAPEALPYPADRGRHEAWVGRSGTTALLAWTNEPEDPLVPQAIRVAAGGGIGYTGYLTDPSDDDRLAGARDLGAAVERAGGCFAVFRTSEEGYEAATTISRVNPVYAARAPGLAVAGSRAILVHLVARAVATGEPDPDPEYDLLALHWIVRSAFFLSEDTPFVGVAPLAAASTLRVVGTTERVVSRPVTPTLEARAGSTRADIDLLANAVVAAVEPLRHHAEPPNLALSGGRDSRMLAAALHAARIPFTATTRGFPDHPDVVVARQVAAVLDIRHNVADPRRGRTGDRLRVEHPLERTNRAVWIGEGMNSAYDDLTGWVGFRPAARLSGTGGEIIRGGFLRNERDVSDAAITDRIERMFTGGPRVFVPEADARASAELARWQALRQAPADAMAALYLLYRTGRWMVGPRTSCELNWLMYHPFLDNVVVQRAGELPALTRWAEGPAHGLITRLAPELRDLPLEGRRWQYEARWPASLADLGGWRRRHAVRPRGGTSGFDYRKKHDRAFADLLREPILDGPANLFRLVDRAKVETLLAATPLPTTAWRLLTVSVLLSGSWRRGAWRPFETVEVPLPGA